MTAAALVEAAGQAARWSVRALRLRQWGRGAALLLLPVALAAQPAAPAASAASAVDAAHWLARIQGAAANRSYQGTMVVSSGAGVVSNSRIAHICDGRQRFERIEVLDGRARTQYRHNDQIVTLWPGTRTAVLEQRDPVLDFPALPAAAASTRVADLYELRHVGTDRVAGLEADVLMVKPRDGLRFAQRWWTDRDSGLLLRSDTLGPKGEVLESSAFTDVSLPGKATPDMVAGPMKRLDGWRVLKRPTTRALLDAEGWTLAQPVPGFQMVSCSKRPLDTAADDAPAPQVLQTVYTDGVAQVSVFVEPFDPQRHKQPMRSVVGATHTLMARRGDWWLTVVGEVPMATVQQFEAAFERRR